MKELVRYIHLNPLRAKAVSSLEELNRYPYSGHSALMNRKKRPWQETEYVLGFFGNRVGEARRRYLAYVRDGIEQGRRKDLVGGGLIRSLGGWEAVKDRRREEQGRIKGDERILGESDFVAQVLAEANERRDRRYELKSFGIDLEKVTERVCMLCDVERRRIFSRDRQKRVVSGRSLLCYWGVRELGMSLADLSKRLLMTPSAVSYAVSRGQKLAEANKYGLID